jgi:zinc protease
MREEKTVIQTKLPNGLQVMLKEIHTAPLSSHWIWYRVGSRQEKAGYTGISHWVEHMQFKGTPTFPASVLDKAISREGGIWNAFTYMDWTAYFETLPADRIRLALELEADRMQNSMYENQEVEAERSVIISEREGNENEPLFRLGEAVQFTAFEYHPYKTEVIGKTEDLLNIKRDDLFNHYRSYYTPGNAVLAIAGDFSGEEMLSEIMDIYGSIPEKTVPHVPIQRDESTDMEKRLEIFGPGETTYLEIAYHAPEASHADFFAFTILDSLLTGPSSLNMFGGGGISNKTSRLYRALIEKDLAVSVHGGIQATIDPYLYDITITIHPHSTVGAVLEVFDSNIDILQNKHVSAQDIAIAVKQAKALFAYGTENITNQAFWLGYAEMFANYEWFTRYLEKIQQVTAEDVLRIARTYLKPGSRVVGSYLPEDAVGGKQ